jgi:hypothetical protein
MAIKFPSGENFAFMKLSFISTRTGCPDFSTNLSCGIADESREKKEMMNILGREIIFISYTLKLPIKKPLKNRGFFIGL